MSATWVEVFAYQRDTRPPHLETRYARQTFTLVNGKWLVRYWERVFR